MIKIGDIKLENGHFYSPTQGILKPEELLISITDFVKADPNSFYSLIIGSDSQTKRSDGKIAVNFVTAVVIHRHGHGGRYFWKNTKESHKFSLREKIYQETLYSINLAFDIAPKLRLALGPKCYELEIHVDIAESGPTRELIKEVVGMVSGNGFTAKTKPYSYGAFVVADKHT